MNSYKIEVDVCFQENKIHKLRFSVPAKSEGEAFDKASDFVSAKLSTKVSLVKVNSAENVISDIDDLEEKISKYKDSANGGTLTEDELKELEDGIIGMAEFIKIKRKYGKG